VNADFTTEEAAFQQEVRDFLESEFPADIKYKVENNLRLQRQDYIRWQQILHTRGWMAPNWPQKYGGTGWTPTQNYIFNQEMGRVGAPEPVPFGVKMVAPVIITFGTEDQKQRFLPDILESKAWWCQGYSEPNSGSDLASLKTTAVRDGDEYIVNGTKTWNTLGQYADWIFCLVRTDSSAKKQEGISFLLIDMSSPGVSVNPIVLMDGTPEVNEVVFENVRVPVENRVGEENRGWTYAKVLLTHERTNIARVAYSMRRLERLKELAQQREDGNGGVMFNDPEFSNKLTRLEIDLKAVEYTELRTLSAVSAGKAPGPESSILKIVGTQITQRIDEMYLQLAGQECLPFVMQQFEPDFEGEKIGTGIFPSTALTYFNNRKVTIYGGSNEIQKNIICKAVLGL